MPPVVRWGWRGQSPTLHCPNKAGAWLSRVQPGLWRSDSCCSARRARGSAPKLATPTVRVCLRGPLRRERAAWVFMALDCWGPGQLSDLS